VEIATMVSSPAIARSFRGNYPTGSRRTPQACIGGLLPTGCPNWRRLREANAAPLPAVMKVLPSSVEEGVGGGADCGFMFSAHRITTPALGAPPLLNQEGSIFAKAGRQSRWSAPARSCLIWTSLVYDRRQALPSRVRAGFERRTSYVALYYSPPAAKSV
jgi:hypothetical protein